jgi:perosamine synthetase
MKYEWPTPSIIRIPVSRPKVTDSDVERVMLAVKSAQLSRGASQGNFEKEFGNYHDLKVLTVSNGSVAIMLALRSLGIGPGDEVIVPALSYAATASSVLNVGAVPVFVDVETNDWNISSNLIQSAISKKTKAIVAVHNYGHAFDIEAISRIATEFGLFVIEDTAEALGGSFNGKPLGSFFDISTWSFYGNKVITSGEGGAIGTKSSALLDKIQLLRGQGMDPQRQFYFLEPGYNFRLSNLNCTLVASQFDRLPDILLRRKEIFSMYHDRLSSIGVFQSPLLNSVPAPWLLSFRLKSKSTVHQVALALANAGIETRPIFYPLPEMPAFRNFRSTSFDNSKLISESGISLPTYEDLTEPEISLICKIINESIK